MEINVLKIANVTGFRAKLPGKSCSQDFYRNRDILGLKNVMALFIAILCILKVTINYMEEEIKIFSSLKTVISVVEFFIH